MNDCPMCEQRRREAREKLQPIINILDSIYSLGDDIPERHRGNIGLIIMEALGEARSVPNGNEEQGQAPVNPNTSQNSGVPPSPASQEWTATDLHGHVSAILFPDGGASDTMPTTDAHDIIARHNAALRAAVEASKDKDLGEQ